MKTCRIISLVIICGIAIAQQSDYGSKATGGEGGKTVTPTTLQELKTYLNQNGPLTIQLTKTFDFTGSEGKTTSDGCIRVKFGACTLPKPPSATQKVIIPKGKTMATAGGCDNGTPTTVTFDQAGINRLRVSSDKTLIGVGKSGVLKGKGLQIDGSNVIIRNIHITEINPEYIWGGDAIYAGLNEGAVISNVWIDHVTFSSIARQMLVTGYQGVDGLVVTNNFFDGRTQFSSKCDGHHYWTAYFTGAAGSVTVANNYFYYTSGRSPKITNLNGYASYHFYNNYFNDLSGTTFEVDGNVGILIEGNYMNNVKVPYEDKGKHSYIPSDTASCQDVLGRACVANKVEASGPFETLENTEVLKQFSAFGSAKTANVLSPVELQDSTKNFGIGDLNSEASKSNTTPTPTPAPTPNADTPSTRMRCKPRKSTLRF